MNAVVELRDQLKNLERENAKQLALLEARERVCNRPDDDGEC